MLRNPRTVSFETPRRFIGFHTTTPSSFNPAITESANVVPQLFDKLRRSLLDQGISHSGELFGISIPADNETPPMTISYFAGIESDISADDDFDELEVEPGNYFAVTYEGPMSTFDEAVVEIYGPLFSSTGHHVRDGKHLEIYGEAFNPDSDDSRMDVLIPIL